VIAALALCLAPAAALAQEQTPPAEEVTDSVISGPGITQRIGGRLGVEAGGRSTPGGLHVGGSFLYLLDGPYWFDAGIGFTFGGGAAGCFRDRDNDGVCDHGIASGFAAEVVASVRRELGSRDGFTPYVRVGIAARLIAFGGDDVRGLGIPLIGSVGVRREVTDGIAVAAAFDLRTGWGFFNRSLGPEAHASASINAGVEFDLP
jgi:hypothetical protein